MAYRPRGSCRAPRARRVRLTRPADVTSSSSSNSGWCPRRGFLMANRPCGNGEERRVVGGVADRDGRRERRPELSRRGRGPRARPCPCRRPLVMVIHRAGVCRRQAIACSAVEELLGTRSCTSHERTRCKLRRRRARVIGKQVALVDDVHSGLERAPPDARAKMCGASRQAPALRDAPSDFRATAGETRRRLRSRRSSARRDPKRR